MSDVFVFRQENYDEISLKTNFLKSFDEIKFNFTKLKTNATILIKPNILGHQSSEKHVTTNPKILDALLDILTKDYSKKNFKIIIGESSGVMLNGGTKKGFETSGIKEIADKYDVSCIDFESSDKLSLDTKKLKEKYYLEDFTLPKLLSDCDLIINLPKLKTHVLMDYTGAIKNFYGLIPGSQKMVYHAKAPTQKKFSKIIADIYQYLLSLKKPILNIMDGIYGMEGNGPANGKVKKARIILVSTDAVALDIVATNIIGFNSLKLSFIQELLKRKFNPFPIQQKGISKIKIPFKKAFNLKSNIPEFLKKQLTTLLVLEPVIDNKTCKRCMVCLSQCPVDAIKYNKKSKQLKIDKKTCIHCFCCHELCPHDSIELKRGIDNFNILKKLKEVKNE